MVGYWIFMLIEDLLMPVVMLVFGFFFSKRAPKKINYIFGYRTARSMKNRDTWEFAHRLIGKIWKWLGLILTVAVAITLGLCFGRSIPFVSIAATIVVGVELVVMIASIFPVESALKRTFDEDGFRKNA